MELLFESRREVLAVAGRVRAVQGRPVVLPEPVLVPDTFADGAGTTIYGTVLRDGGVFRMWYQAWPADWDGRTVDAVGYAESSDGLTWRKPALHLVDYGPDENNLCDLALHSPSIYIDPDAPSTHRYRATGYTGPGRPGARPSLVERGYYTAHSADGLHWSLGGDSPRWPGGDVITSVYHPARGAALVSLKQRAYRGGVPRRSVWQTQVGGGSASDLYAALIPDAYDDVCAVARGAVSGDYYGMGMMPAGQGTVGFLWHFWHRLPRTAGNHHGIYGFVDVGLVFQASEGDAWLHVHGRPDFLPHTERPWMAGGVYTAACPVEVGDEQWLYFSGALRTHAWPLDETWQLDESRCEVLRREGMTRIGLAHWPKDRLFGFWADGPGALDLDLGVLRTASELVLNYEAETRHGSIRVEILGVDGRSAGDCCPLVSSAFDGIVRWQTGAVVLPDHAGRRLTARLSMENATVYAFEVRPVG